MTVGDRKHQINILKVPDDQTFLIIIPKYSLTTEIVHTKEDKSYG